MGEKPKTKIYRKLFHGKFEVVGWILDGNLTKTKGPLFPKLKTFGGRTLKAVTFHHPPITYVNKMSQDGLLLKYSGFEVKLFRVISEALKFNFVVRTPSDGKKWGSELRPGIFDGISGDIKSNRADVGWANFWMMENRLRNFDFPRTHYQDFVCNMVKVPKTNRLNWKALWTPFHWQTWIVGTGAFALCQLILLSVSVDKIRIALRLKKVESLAPVAILLWQPIAIKYLRLVNSSAHYTLYRAQSTEKTSHAGEKRKLRMGSRLTLGLYISEIPYFPSVPLQHGLRMN